MQRIPVQPPSCQPEPEGARCLTCGDDAVEVTVVSLLTGAMALVALDGATLEVDVSLVEELAPGDRLLAHGGVALARIASGEQNR